MSFVTVGLSRKVILQDAIRHPALFPADKAIRRLKREKLKNRIKKKLKFKGGKMLQLFVESKVAANPTTVVRWCTNAETLAKLKSESRENPCVLIVDYSVKKKNEHRYIRPLSELAFYIPFKSSGAHRIFITICWDKTENGIKLSSPEDNYLSRSDSKYRTTVLNSGNSAFLNDLENTMDQAMETVAVDPKLFPAKPWDWKWVNFWFTHPAFDQCHMRRRRIFPAYSLQPFIVAIGWIFMVLVNAVVCLWNLAIGRVPNWKYVNPFRIDIFSGEPKYIYWDQSWYWNKPWLWMFRPIYPILTFVIFMVLGRIFNATHSANVMYLAVGTFCVVFIAIVIGNAVLKKFDEQDIKRAREEAQKRRWLEKLEEQYQRSQVALCSFVDRVNPTRIPRKARSSRLVFDEIKREVCRSYEED
ncbi:MAG: hypothetical protein WCT08_02100 [Patescibacteria group bacterium]|jgi:hypothetical protein